MTHLIQPKTPVTEAVLTAIAHLPTRSLNAVVHPDFWSTMEDADYMRLAVILAEKSNAEGGCPIGGVVVEQATGRVVGKGHNTLVQEDHPYNHGETSAMRDAGRIDFSRTTLFTTLSPCDICATLVYMRGVARLVVGDVTNAQGNEAMLRERGVQVDVLEDARGVAGYADYRRRKPEQDLEDWRGVAALSSGGPSSLS